MVHLKSLGMGAENARREHGLCRPLDYAERALKDVVHNLGRRILIQL